MNKLQFEIILPKLLTEITSLHRILKSYCHNCALKSHQINALWNRVCATYNTLKSHQPYRKCEFNLPDFLMVPARVEGEDVVAVTLLQRLVPDQLGRLLVEEVDLKSLQILIPKSFDQWSVHNGSV